MYGSDFGKAVSAYLAGLVIAVFIGGGVVALGGYFLISWIADHLSIGIGWN